MQNQDHIPAFFIDQLRGLHTESLPGLFNRMSTLENNFDLIKVALEKDMEKIVSVQKQTETSLGSRIDSLKDSLNIVIFVMVPVILANFAAIIYIILR